MSEGLAGALDKVAQKWRRLAERRRAHFVELYYSGRWKHYYTEERFLLSMREAIRAAERWAMISPPADEADEATSVESTAPAGASAQDGNARRDAA
jgi:uncharacterized repeat protein (TIGR03809 family)